jgi:hypothetical protein
LDDGNVETTKKKFWVWIGLDLLDRFTKKVLSFFLSLCAPKKKKKAPARTLEIPNSSISLARSRVCICTAYGKTLGGKRQDAISLFFFFCALQLQTATPPKSPLMD